MSWPNIFEANDNYITFSYSDCDRQFHGGENGNLITNEFIKILVLFGYEVIEEIDAGEAGIFMSCKNDNRRVFIQSRHDKVWSASIWY